MELGERRSIVSACACRLARTLRNETVEQKLMKTPDQIREDVQAALAGATREFHPCAFFDDRLDCIRMIARDRSVLEPRSFGR